MLAGRYGSIESISGKSYIHLEYEHAAKHRKPFVILVMDDTALEKKAEKYNAAGKEAMEENNPDKYSEFKALLKGGKMCKMYEDKKDIAYEINKKLNEYRDRSELVGWVNGSEAGDYRAAVDQICQLQDHKIKLME